jgi:ATP-dependent Clp protease adaptor protein ClpS
MANAPATKDRTVLRPEEKQAVQRPRLYRVLLHNDDYTTMEFVVFVLQKVFSKPLDEAVTIMLTIHRDGLGICGIYPCEIAETKVKSVHTYAREEGYPLRSSMEPE